MTQLRVETNPNQNKNHVLEYSKTTNGAYRILATSSKVSELTAIALATANPAASAFASEFGGRLASASYFLTPFRIPESVQKVKTAVSEWNTKTSLRDREGQVHDLAEAVQIGAYSTALVMKNPAPALHVANMATVVTDMSDLMVGAEDCYRAHKLASSAQTANKEVAEDTRTSNLFKVIKAITGLASAVLGLMVLAFGGPVLPAVALLTISLVSNVAAIAGHFFKETHRTLSFPELVTV